MRVIEVSERSTVDIPFSELLHSGGQFKIRPDLIGKGLVEIFQARNALKLRVNGLVGRLPVTETLALDVQPKFPVSNLNRMVYASRGVLSDPFDFRRPYERFRTREYLPVPLIRSLSRHLKHLIGHGIHRSYKREVIEASPKPRIDFMKSHQKFWAKLDPTRAVIERFDFTQDNTPNRCLKLAARKSLALAKASPYLTDCVPIFAAGLRQLERVSLLAAQDLQADLPHIHTLISSERHDYHAAMSAAIEIIRNIDVSLDISSSGVSLDSYIISMDDVFEQYIRSTIATLPDQGSGKISTVDGNIRRHQRRLFFDSKKYLVKPDLITKIKNDVLIIGDVKYKEKPKEVDRYQVISHALAYGVESAVLVYPKSPLGEMSGLVNLGRIGDDRRDIFLHEYYFDLSGDLCLEEQKFRNAIVDLL